jgi:hypothetical protein
VTSVLPCIRVSHHCLAWLGSLEFADLLTCKTMVVAVCVLMVICTSDVTRWQGQPKCLSA